MSDDALELAAAMGALPLEQQALLHKRRRAEMLAGTPTPEGRQIGRVYRASSPLEHLASGLARAMGYGQMGEADKEYQGLVGRAQQGYAAAAEQKRLIDAQRAAQEQANRDRDFQLRQGAETRADAAAMAREADAARDAAYQQRMLGLKEKELVAAGTRAKDEAESKRLAGRSKVAEDLRKEFQNLQTYKNTQVIGESYKKIAGTSDTGAGDVSLIYSYMRMVDPGSTVREGEFATAANAGGVPDRVLGLYNRVLRGEKLPPEVRKQFRDESKNLLKAQVDRYEETAKPYRRLAEQAGASPADVVLDLGLAQYLDPPAAPQRQVVRTGTDKRTGKKVVQYADGTIEEQP